MQGCQTVYFHTKKSKCKFWTDLEWKLLVYLMTIWLVYLVSIWHSLWLFGGFLPFGKVRTKDNMASLPDIHKIGTWNSAKRGPSRVEPR
jgi:hypothetical protein